MTMPQARVAYEARTSHLPSSIRRSTVWLSRPRRTLFLLQAGDLTANFPLNLLGRCFESVYCRPDLVLLAGGPQAQATWSALEPFFGEAPRLWMEPTFDDASFDARMDILRAAPADVEQILLIAQSPTIP